MDDERIRTLLCEELDRREAEAQSLCPHRRSGTLRDNLVVTCDQCNKPMDQDDIDNAFGGAPEPALAPLEQQYVGKMA